MESVFELAQCDTQLKKVSVNEYAGPCPACGGRDRFHVNLRKRDGRGAWMCRVCRPAEMFGWGDDVDYLVAFRGMSKREALKIAREQLNTLLNQAQVARKYAAPDDDKPPREAWQEKAREYVERAQHALWHTPAGRAALEYVRGRGLQDETIRAAQLGFSLDRDRAGNASPYLVIPWHTGDLTGTYWAINRRDLRDDRPAGAPRYKLLFGSSKQGLYGGSLLARSRKFPTFLVEGELDALILAQEARGLSINVVATGGQTSILTRWAIRLARMPLVLLAQDNEDKGNNQARAWLEVLPNARRYRPLEKDVNAMHLEGWSVRTWIEAALDMLPVEPSNLNSAIREQDQAAQLAAVFPGAPSSVLEDVAALLGVLDRDQARAWMQNVRAAWSARDVAALADYGEQIDYPGALFVERLGFQVEPIAPAIVKQDPGEQEQDAGAAFLDQVKTLVDDAGAWPEGYSLRLVEKEFAARIHALPDLAITPSARSSLDTLPRKHCAALVSATTDIPGETKRNRSQVARPCAGKPRANGWCEEHQRSALLLDIGAALGYPRVEVSECNIIPAGLRSWEQYAAHSHTAIKAALPRVKRLVEQACNQNQVTS